VDDAVVSSINSTLQHHHEKEDTMKALFIGARNAAQCEIADLLLDFRQKRSLGHISTTFFLLHMKIMKPYGCIRLHFNSRF